MMVIDLVFIALVGGAFYWVYRHIRRLREQQAGLTAKLTAALRELDLLTAMNSTSGGRMVRVERDCAQLSDRIGLIELRGETRPYHQAIDSARNGADPAKLAREFGLSSHEANLLMLVHGARASSV